MLRIWCFVGAVWLALFTTATAAEPVSMQEWTTYEKHRQSYSESGVHLKFQRHEDKDISFIELSLSMRGAPRHNISFKDGFYTPQVTYAVTRIDPAYSKRDVLIIRNNATDCCSNPIVFSLVQGRWRKIDFGPYIDAALTVEYVPQAKPNGRVVLGARDRRFVVFGEAFCCFQALPRFLTVENGKILDISIDPAFAETFEETASSQKFECLGTDEHRNDSCATYVAASARLGRFKEAWQTMLKHYNREPARKFGGGYSFCLAKEFSDDSGNWYPGTRSLMLNRLHARWDDCDKWSPESRSLPETLGPSLVAWGYISQAELDSVRSVEETPPG